MEVGSKCGPLLFVFSILFTPGCTFLLDWDGTASSAPLVPHFTECISTERTTFRCWWSPGSFQNLSYPEDLLIFYLKKRPFNSEWKECPRYNYLNQECFFDANHTTAWATYCLKLHVHNVTYTHEDDCFTLDDIVRPDPPVALNWTLLNISPSGVSYDVLVSWDPPPSADVSAGWMNIEYELQYRELNSTTWKPLKIQSDLQQTIYGLRVGKEYEVHIHTRMQTLYSHFGEFSTSMFIEVVGTGEEGTSFPVMLVLIFGISGIVIIIMFIVVSQHHRLMMILLPPVPAPKIKGIDSELLKKGKLGELNFILGGGGMGSLPPNSTDFYQDEPWVEFIEVETEGADTGEKEENQASDTQRLLSLSQPAGHHMHIGNSNTVCFPDDDSGRASCYDSDHPDQDPLIPMATLLPGQPEDRDPIIINTQPIAPQTWVNTDFYAQVSNVMPSGGVVLSPGQQLRIQEHQKDTKKGNKTESYEDNTEDLHFQLVVVDQECAAEDTQKQNGTPPVSPVSHEGYHTIPLQPAEPKLTEELQSPYILPPESPQSPIFIPVADYTVVQEVDSQHSLLLNPPPQQQAPPPSCPPQHPLKSLPAMPVDYISPDLFGNLSQ